MKRIKQLKREGYNKREVFNRASADGLVPVKVARYLATYPDADDAAKYNTANNALIGIFVLSIFLSPLWARAMLEPLPIGVWLFIFILMVNTVYCLYRKMLPGYMLVCAIMLVAISISLANGELLPLTAAQITFFAAVIAFSFTLKTKLYPFQGIIFLKKDRNGLARFTKALVDDDPPEQPVSKP